MAIAAFIYAIYLAYTVIASAWENAREKRPLWLVLPDLAAQSIILLLFCAYWFAATRRFPQPASALLYASSLFWFLGWIPQDWARFQREDLPADLNPQQRRLAFTGIVASLLPAYWFAGVAALRAQ